jgi:hypothetical protein
VLERLLVQFWSEEYGWQTIVMIRFWLSPRPMPQGYGSPIRKCGSNFKTRDSRAGCRELRDLLKAVEFYRTGRRCDYTRMGGGSRHSKSARTDLQILQRPERSGKSSSLSQLRSSPHRVSLMSRVREGCAAHERESRRRVTNGHPCAERCQTGYSKR